MREIRSSEFAAKLGVNRSTISQALKGLLAPAKLRRGVVDLDHPCVAEYEKATKLRLEQYAVGKQKAGRGSPRRKKRGDTDTDTDTDTPKNKLDKEQTLMVLSDFPDDIRKISKLPLIDIIRRYGTASSLKEYVTAVKYMEQTRKSQLENRQREGELIDRALLTALLGILDGAYIDLLKDGAKNISRRTAQKTLAGATPEDIEVFVRELIGRYLKIANQKIQMAIRAVEG